MFAEKACSRRHVVVTTRRTTLPRPRYAIGSGRASNGARSGRVGGDIGQGAVVMYPILVEEEGIMPGDPLVRGHQGSPNPEANNI